MKTNAKRFWAVVLAGMLSVVQAARPAVAEVATQLVITHPDIVGPLGSERFGERVTILPNGNIVVVDSKYDLHWNGTVAEDVGAVYLYKAGTSELISRLIGGTAGDQVGSGGVAVLPSGNFVVSSPWWNNGLTENAGAATWVNAVTGLNSLVALISSSNSLVGSHMYDGVSWSGITVLTNGNYVVVSSGWSGTAKKAGAVTFGAGIAGVTGEVNASNSLVGGQEGDNVGGIEFSVVSL